MNKAVTVILLYMLLLMLASIITLDFHVEQGKNTGKAELEATHSGCSIYTLIYDPGAEGMDPFSEPLSSPKTLYESVPPGASFNIVWVYEYQG